MARFINYAPVPQRGPDDVEETDVFLSTQTTHLPTPWKRVVLLLGTALVGSVCANVFFIYRQFAVPWALLEELPTQFGR